MITAMFGLTAYLLTIIIVQGQQVEFETFTNSSIIIINIFYYIYLGSIYSSFLLLTSMSLCMYILAIHHHQFTSWVADLIFLLVCLILSQLTAITLVIAISSLPYQSLVVLLIELIYFILLFLATVGFAALTLVPMCCRACGYNLWMRSVASIESHRQALRETLPLFILLSPNVVALAIGILAIALEPADILIGQLVLTIALPITGLLLSLSFAVHLCILGKTKLMKLRGKKRPLPTTYRTFANQPHTHRTTVFTSERISETCNTDYPHVSEDEVDRELLQDTRN